MHACIQIGNNSFLNKNLMARAQNGLGKKNDKKLSIGIVGARLTSIVATMDLANALQSGIVQVLR